MPLTSIAGWAYFCAQMGIIIKTPLQIEGIRKAGHLARRALNELDNIIKPGITTGEIDLFVKEFLADHGAVAGTLGYRGYPASSCISVNDVVCHGIPGKLVIREGDIVNVDITAKLNNYFGDTCKMYAVGEISPQAQGLLRVTRECLDIGIAQVFPGNAIGNIGFNIAKHAHAQGYQVVYQFCGHGVGLSLHEAEPEISHIDEKNRGAKMKEGMVFTIEPMINIGKARVKIDRDGWTARTIDGKLSAQYEHTVAVTADGVDVLTDVNNEYAKPETTAPAHPAE